AYAVFGDRGFAGVHRTLRNAELFRDRAASRSRFASCARSPARTNREAISFARIGRHPSWLSCRLGLSGCILARALRNALWRLAFGCSDLVNRSALDASCCRLGSVDAGASRRSRRSDAGAPGRVVLAFVESAVAVAVQHSANLSLIDDIGVGPVVRSALVKCDGNRRREDLGLLAAI